MSRKRGIILEQRDCPHITLPQSRQWCLRLVSVNLDLRFHCQYIISNIPFFSKNVRAKRAICYVLVILPLCHCLFTVYRVVSRLSMKSVICCYVPLYLSFMLKILFPLETRAADLLDMTLPLSLDEVESVFSSNDKALSEELDPLRRVSQGLLISVLWCILASCYGRST